MTLRRLDIRPGPSSQVTSAPVVWLPSGQLEEKIVIEGASLYANNFVVCTPRGETWDEVMEDVLRGRAELWKRLANL